MRLVSYNIQYGTGRDGRVDLGRIAAALEGADVIALQEVERGWPHSGRVDQPAALAALLPGYHWVYGAGFDVHGADGRRQHGTMLLARTPILSSLAWPLPMLATTRALNMRMTALAGVIGSGLGPLRVYSVHFSSLSSRERLLQAEALLGYEADMARARGPWTGAEDAPHWTLSEPPPEAAVGAIVMGDLNCEPGSPEYDALVGAADPLHGRIAYADRWVDAWVAAGRREGEGISYPPNGRYRGLRLDHCLVSAGLVGRVRGAWIAGEAAGSDHQPLWVEIDA